MTPVMSLSWLRLCVFIPSGLAQFVRLFPAPAFLIAAVNRQGGAPLNYCWDSRVHCIHGGEGSSQFLERNCSENNLKTGILNYNGDWLASNVFQAHLIFYRDLRGVKSQKFIERNIHRVQITI